MSSLSLPDDILTCPFDELDYLDLGGRERRPCDLTHIDCHKC